jgi:HAD superfamily hydrolase (TIGR01509 family)
MSVKVVALDLGGVYFKAGTGIALKHMYGMIGTDERTRSRAAEIFEPAAKKEGWLYRAGKLGKGEFWNTVVRDLGVRPDDVPALQEMWHSSYTPNEGMPELVRRLREKCKVVVISGNIRERIEYLDAKYGLRDEFDGLVLSYEEGFTKAEPELYKALIKKLAGMGFAPEECVGVDDKEEYLRMERDAGIGHTILFEDAAHLEAELSKLGLAL